MSELKKKNNFVYLLIMDLFIIKFARGNSWANFCIFRLIKIN